MARVTVFAPVITQGGDRQVVKIPRSTTALIVKNPVMLQSPDAFQIVEVPLAPTGK